MTPEQLSSIEEKAKLAIPTHPYPDMEYPAIALTIISRQSWKQGYLQALEDINNPFPNSNQAGIDWSDDDPQNEKFIAELEEMNRVENRPENIQDFI